MNRKIIEADLVIQVGSKKMFPWTDQYVLNVPLIDKQHKALFEYINKLYEAMDKKNMMARIYRRQTIMIIEDLFSLTKVHFSNEEYLMVGSDYPDYQVHKKAHEDFLDQIKNLYSLYHNTSNSIYKIGLINCYLLNFIKGCMLEHLLEVDKKFASFFIEQGCLNESGFLDDGHYNNFYTHIHLAF